MGVYLTGVHLTGVHFMGVYLTSMHLISVYLTGVHFMGMYLMGVHFIDVYLTGGMDQGSEFECEFRARRIRVRGNFAHKSLLKLSTVPPVGDARPYMPIRYMP